MKILNRTQFLACPAGTVFAKYEPQSFGELSIKGDNCGANDFYYTCLNDCIDAPSSDDMSKLLDLAVSDGIDVPVKFEAESRDGMFDQEQLFAVFSHEETHRLAYRLNMSAYQSQK